MDRPVDTLIILKHLLVHTVTVNTVPIASFLMVMLNNSRSLKGTTRIRFNTTNLIRQVSTVKILFTTNAPWMKAANILTIWKLFLVEMLNVSTDKIADFSILMDKVNTYLEKNNNKLVQEDITILRIMLTNSLDIAMLFSKIIVSTVPAVTILIIWKAFLAKIKHALLELNANFYILLSKMPRLDIILKIRLELNKNLYNNSSIINLLNNNINNTDSSENLNLNQT